MDDIAVSCPIPTSTYHQIVLPHGGGGRLMHSLIADVFQSAFAGPDLQIDHDGATLALTNRIVVSTDTFTVHPLVFPGGDIGRLAVCGTVNDVAMCGAMPRHLTAAFILEEGLSIALLKRVVASMAAAAREAQVTIVSGDTKVVERGKGDGIFITTTGIGVLPADRRIEPQLIRAGDLVLVSANIGDHGIAVMSERAGPSIITNTRSDVAPVNHLVAALFDAGIDIHCLRDPTRGGLATTLCEIANTSQLGIKLRESSIPVRPEVADTCELLGFDPLYVASEGCFVAIVDPEHGERAITTLRSLGADQAALIGHVTSDHAGIVSLENIIGSERVLDMLSGEQLPRIC